MADIPIQLRAEETVTINLTDVESTGWVTITMCGDIGSLLPHLTQFVVDAMQGLAE